MSSGAFFNPILTSGTSSSMFVDFVASTQSTGVGIGITFSNLSDPTPTFNYWTFGDGSFSTASNPNKTYNFGGTFSITLRAVDDVSGGIEEKINYINTSLNTTGGIEDTITISGDLYKRHTFLTSGTFTTDSPLSIYYLLVGGGGGGHARHNGGGGAGGVLTNFGASTFDIIPNSFSVVVGAGGNGTPLTISGSIPPPTKGGDTSFAGLTAFGGGANTTGSKNGGSGCGVSFAGDPVGTGVSGQGNNGGVGSVSVSSAFSYAGGGGGGAGAVGGAATNNGAFSPNAGGAGGLGRNLSTWVPDYGTNNTNTLTGTRGFFGGGGGGGNAWIGLSNPASAAGGGGRGGSDGPGENGITNTGGGGGGGGFRDGGGGVTGYASGNGGSGIVIIMYKIS